MERKRISPLVIPVISSKRFRAFSNLCKATAFLLPRTPTEIVHGSCAARLRAFGKGAERVAGSFCRIHATNWPPMRYLSGGKFIPSHPPLTYPFFFFFGSLHRSPHPT